MTRPNALLRLCLLPLGLVAGHAHAGAEILWPGTGTCAGTLQACIDAAPSQALIRLIGNVPIGEDITISRSLTLRGSNPNVRATFADGRGISLSNSGSGDFVVRLQNLGFRNGQIIANYTGSGRAELEFSGLQMRADRANEPSGIIASLSPSGGTAVHQVQVINNDLELTAPSFFDAGVQLTASGSGRRARFEVHHNRIRAVARGEGQGVSIDALGGADVDASAFANDIQGAFGRALWISEGRFGSAPSVIRADVVSNALVGDGNFQGGGLMVATNNGTIELEAINNSIVSGFGLTVTRWSSSAPQTGQVTGGIFNNLIAYTRFGLQNTPDVGGNATVDWNLKWQNDPPGLHTPGANDINAEPQLRAQLAPRLSAGSPARDAGNGFALLRVPAALINHDADGLRRLVGTVDIGAFEFGHRTLLRRKTSAAAVPEFPVSDFELDLDSNRRLFVTRNYSAGPVDNNRAVGVTFFDQWLVTNLNGQAMPQGTAFNLFAPLGNSTSGVFQHVANGSNTLDSSSLIDWSTINGRPERIVLATQATPLGTPFHPGPVVLSYVGTRWNLVTADGSNMATNTRWNLYSQLPSPQAFVHEVSQENRISDRRTVIAHPRLDGVACAQIQVMPLSNGSIGGSILDVEYLPASQRHTLLSNNGDLPTGARFHVMVFPEQIEDCKNGALFRNGFEGP